MKQPKVSNTDFSKRTLKSINSKLNHFLHTISLKYCSYPSIFVIIRTKQKDLRYEFPGGTVIVDRFVAFLNQHKLVFGIESADWCRRTNPAILGLLDLSAFLEKRLQSRLNMSLVERQLLILEFLTSLEDEQ